MLPKKLAEILKGHKKLIQKGESKGRLLEDADFLIKLLPQAVGTGIFVRL